mmetsp:Transcript_55678/g.113360  ORF Transcript_55678/g.113360 Transcript_55678/m.113360 type:complete len:375 (+) Transcript_55678:348-1472(+)
MAVRGGDVVAAATGEGNEVFQARAGICCHRQTLRVQHKASNLPQFSATVVLKAEGEGHAALEARVRVEEAIHLCFIARQDDYHVLALVFHLLDQGIHGFLPKAVLAIAHQSIGFIDEEHSANGSSDGLFHLRSSLSQILRHHIHSGGFFEDQWKSHLSVLPDTLDLGLFLQLLFHVIGHVHHTHLHHHLSHDARHDRLASARIAQEAHVERLAAQAFHAQLFPPETQLHQSKELTHGLLDTLQPHQAAQLLQQRLQLLRILHELQVVIDRCRWRVWNLLQGLEGSLAIGIVRGVRHFLPVLVTNDLQGGCRQLVQDLHVLLGFTTRAQETLRNATCGHQGNVFSLQHLQRASGFFTEILPHAIMTRWLLGTDRI